MAIKFDLPKETLTIIKVVGVGGGGSNAVNHMYTQGITGVDFIVCNTDQQALDISPVPVKIQLGATLTEGLGAGAKAEVGKNAAIENIEEIKGLLDKSTKMIFITAGMGGGTGTGAAPVIAKAAKDLDILTVGIVTMPFSFEGKRRLRQAEEGIKEMRDAVDTLLVINNDKLREMYGNLTLENAFEQADNVLTIAAKGIAETITKTGRINVDFKDIETVMKNSGVALMGSARATGQDRARRVVEDALACPLLNDNEIRGAEHILLNITYGSNSVLMDEITEITDFIQDEAGDEAEVIWGHGLDDALATDELSITIIATGFKKNPLLSDGLAPESKVKIHTLGDEQKQSQATNSLKPSMPRTPERPNQPTLFERASSEPRTILRPSSFNNIPEEKPSTAPFVSNEKPQTYFEPAATKDTVQPESSEIENIASSESTEKKEFIPAEPVVKYSLIDADSTQEAKKEFIAPDEPTLKTDSDSPSKTSSSEGASLQMTSEERMKFINERLSKLKNISSQVRTPNGIAQLESVPAYKRLSVNLDEVSSSSDSNISRLTLSEKVDEDGEKRTELKSNNSFLHDNVD
jgi:cell division protein FtsZ